MNRVTRAIFTLVLIAAAAPSFASEVRRSYYVATRLPAQVVAARLQIEVPDQQKVEPFSIVRGYAAELTEAEVEELRKSREVRYVELAPERHAFATGNARQAIPYGITMIGAPKLWSINTGRSVRVAVIDTGVDLTHPDIQPLYRGGYDFVNNDADPMDDNGHGTHVAGTIGAMNNDIGVVGVAPNVELYGLKVLNAEGKGSGANILKALDWAVKNSIQVVNLSLGGDGSSDLEMEAYAKAVQAGVIVVAASGNEAASAVSFPAAYPGVIAVGAVSETMSVADFSNQGPELSLVAPGTSVLSTYARGLVTVNVIESNGTEVDAYKLAGAPNRDLAAPYVFCGIGRTQDFTSAVSGKIALIERGELKFSDKVKNAKAAGAIAAVIFDNGLGNLNWTLIGEVCDSAGVCTKDPKDLAFEWLPSLAIDQESGQALAKQVGNSMSIKMGIPYEYAMLQGTSMASPHVAGVAALLLSVAPGSSPEVIKAAMLATAKDLGNAGFDSTYGYGLVDADAAARKLVPSQFPNGKRTTRKRR